MFTIKLLPLLPLLGILAAQTPKTFPAGCDGCIGVGGTSSASGGTCGGAVTITVTVERGMCRWFWGEEPDLLLCMQTRPCKPKVTRTWSGLPADSSVDHCVIIGGEKLCLSPKPSAGPSGSGSSVRDGPNMSCTGIGTIFTVESTACTLTASVTATCSQCSGDI